MSDVIDRACQHVDEILERRILRHINLPVSVSAFECEDCGELIPAERRMKVVGVTRCVSCQEVFEMEQKHYRSVWDD
ncbi:TraR/DksA family transcriptional regulator [Photorhabdus bodei]|uniref:TraR/DksA family transcriptional regulator n=1 Tax=Photorhabdus bodei TaxID=2029681 RepID=A0AAW6BR11_9GAMM|nr:TraR/DksA family transcriptional regulator [Photorhabdus bodei]MDB6374120.1 TraR/DksA family transcriptional regulator [Photorhabdus bodei]